MLQPRLLVFAGLAGLQRAEGLFAMEIYNHGCEHDGLYGFNPQVYDEMLRAGQRLYALSTDDNHDTRPIGDPSTIPLGALCRLPPKSSPIPQ